MTVDLRHLSDSDRLAAVEPYKQRRVELRTMEPRTVRGLLVAAAALRWTYGSPILIVALDEGGEVAVPSAQVRHLGPADDA